MKILIDECLPKRLRKLLDEFEVRTVSEMGWRSLKNGKLLEAASENNFDVFLTVDKKLEFQQNLKSFNISVVIFDVFRNKLEVISPLIPKLKELLPSLSKRTITIIDN